MEYELQQITHSLWALQIEDNEFAVHQSIYFEVYRHPNAKA